MTRVVVARSNDRGTALLLAILLVAALAAVAAAAVITSRSETLIAGSFQHGREALYVADGGLARAVQDLSPPAVDWSRALSGTPSTFVDGSPDSSRQLPGGETVALCCDAGSLTDELQRRGNGGGSWGADTPQWRMFAWGPASAWLAAASPGNPFYVIIWIADDIADGDGDPFADTNDTVVLHSLALGPTGSRRSVRALVRRTRGVDGVPRPGVRLMSWHESRW